MGYVTISGECGTVKKLLGMKDPFPVLDHVYEVNGVKLQACGIDAEYYNGHKMCVTVKLARCIQKPPEEVAAEEAVRKAQESLKAAEDVLNKVKKEK